MPWKQEYVDDWRAADGNNTCRLDHPLDESSLIFELGSHVGEGTQRFLDTFGSKIYAFEPVEKAYHLLYERFRGTRVRCFNLGLGATCETLYVSEADDGSSITKQGDVPIEIVSMEWFLKRHYIEFVDLLDVNIEAAEYDLFDHMIEKDLVRKFGNIQVQFHDYIPNADGRMAAIHEAFSRTHELTYRFPYVYENWRLK
jgi:FkbM family methyltransferase